MRADDGHEREVAGDVAAIVRDTVRRRAQGENLPDERIMAAHPHLRPALAEQLRILRLIDKAESGVLPAPSDVPRRTSPALASDALPGYEITGEVQRGGQGVVYHAVHKATRRPVAIKVLRSGAFADAQGWARFEREVEILARLQHPNIVAIHDRGAVGQSAYLVMDFIAGQSLDRWLAAADAPAAAQAKIQNPKSKIAATLRLFARICDAVNAAHLRGVIHRDLKPGNIRIDAADEPHILDFGLAKLIADEPADDAPSAALTITGQFVGSLPWASPEQAEGEADKLDVRTDVYSLGVILYQMLTGQFPYAVTGRMRDVVQNIVTADPVRPRTLNRDLDDEVETIVLRCLQKEPERRYQSAGELARDVIRYLAGEPIEAKRDSSWYLLRKTLRRHRVPVALATAVGLVVTLSAIALTVMYGRQGRLLLRAERETRHAGQARAFLQRTLDAVTQIGQGRDVALKRALLAELTRSVEPELADPPEVAAIVQDTLGRTYQRLGLYEEAEPHLRTSLALRERLHGRAHLDVAAALHNLAELRKDRSHSADAEPLFREALAIRQRLLPPGHADVAATLCSLGETLQTLGRFAEAEPLHRQALALFCALRGDEHPDVAHCLTGLGLLLTNLEDYHAAEVYFRDALAMNRRLLGDDHPDVATGALNLAKTLHILGDYAGAEPLFREAIALYRRLLGDEHDNVAWGLHRYGLLLQAKGDYARAEAHLREALAIYRHALGDDDPYVAKTLNSLGTLLLDMGDYAAAEPCFAEATETLGRRGGDDPALAWNAGRLGELRQLQGDDLAAEPLLRAALAHRTQRQHLEHPQFVRTLHSLAALLVKRSAYVEAELLLREALEFQQRLLGENHPETADSQSRLGEVLGQAGRPDEAALLLQQSYATLRAALGDEHPHTMNAARRLGACQAIRDEAGNSGTYRPPTPP
jgi:serine/threonine protein kinase/Tfp pilus assembly protein PilF